MANELIVKYGVVLNSGETFSGSSLVTKDYVDGLNSIISLTYSTLYNYVVNGQLIPGQWYRLTDYKSVNFLNGWSIANNNPIPSDPNFSPRELYLGPEEVLILQAKTEYEISEIGYSEKYSKDIIQYEPFTNKIGVSVDIYNGVLLPDSSTVSGFDLKWDGTNVYFDMPTSTPALFGHYFYLYAQFNDGITIYEMNYLYEPLTPNISFSNYQFILNGNNLINRLKVVNNGSKVLLLDLVEADYLNYVNDSLYVDTIYAIGDSYGWITRRMDTSKNVDVPFDFRGRKYRRFGVDLTAVNATLGSGLWGIGDNFKNQGTTGTYSDFYTLNGLEYYNVRIDGMGGPEQEWYRGFNDNNVFLGKIFDCQMRESVFNNTVGDNFYGNTLGQFSNNAVGEYFNYNIAQKLIGNTIANYFSYNSIVYLGYSSIGLGFSYNDLFGDNLDLTTKTGFIYNKSVVSLYSINFTSATHVYGNYSCTILKRSDGQLRLSYLNGSDVVQYVTITS